MSKKIIALVVSLVLVTTLIAGCGNTDTSTTKETSTVKTEATVESPSVEAPKEAAQLVWYMIGAEPKDLATVQTAFDELTMAKLNCKVTMKYIDFADFTPKLSAIINSGEKYDMTFTASWSNDYLSNAQKGAFVELDDLLASAAPKLKEFIPGFVWDAARVKGKIYGMPVFKDISAGLYNIMSKELVEKYGIDPKQMTTIEALEPALAKVKAGEKNIIPMALNSSGFPFFQEEIDNPVTPLSSTVPVGIDLFANNIKIINAYESQRVMNNLRTLHKYFKAGYINKDAATSTENYKNTFVFCDQGFPYADSIWSQAKGFPVVSQQRNKAVVTTSTIIGAMHAISTTSEHADAALKVLELVNTTAEGRNLLAYGVEGKHYKKISENVIEPVKDTYAGMAWSTGTFFKSLYVTAPDPEDKWDVIYAWVMNNSSRSPLLGFSFDKTPVSNEIAAITNVTAKYNPQLYTGTVDPDKVVPKMQDELKKAGIDKVIAECQKQVDAWVASK